MAGERSHYPPVSPLRPALGRRRPIWAHLVRRTPLIAIGAVALLRPLKAALAALQFRHRDLGSSG